MLNIILYKLIFVYYFVLTKYLTPLGILTLISKYYGLLYIIEKYSKTIRSQINVDIILLGTFNVSVVLQSLKRKEVDIDEN